MEARDAIKRKLIKTNMNVTTKDEAFSELVSLLKNEGFVSDEGGFIKDIYLRESEGQTGIGNYIAIPHGKSSHVTEPAVVIGINSSEIPWETLDDNGVKVIVLFAVVNDSIAAQEHLKILSLFARKLGNDQIVEKLINAKNEDDVIEAFS
ncbi:TPA: PTS sugar transporter subunit IIA [Streptococcus agalactiae]